jgi:integrase
MVTKKQRGIFEKVHGSGVWWIHFHDSEGNRRREKVGRRSAAVALYQKRKTEAREGEKLPLNLKKKRVSFSSLAQDALEYSKTHKRSYGDDVIRMKRILEAFADRGAESIMPQDIDYWFAKQNWKPATCNRYRALLSLTFRLGVENRKVKNNPARLVKLRRENNGRIRYLLPEEEVRLRAAIAEKCPHHLPELDFALNSEVRLSEQYGLTWDCVNLDQRVLTIPLSKNGEARHVGINSSALAALQIVHGSANGQNHVFLNRFGQRAAGPRDWFGPAVKEAGLKDFTWHCLRHTFASRLVMAGVDLRTVQEAMGHKTIQVTVRYAHLAPKHQLAALERLCETDGALDGATATRTATNADSGQADDQSKIN